MKKIKILALFVLLTVNVTVAHAVDPNDPTSNAVSIIGALVGVGGGTPDTSTLSTNGGILSMASGVNTAAITNALTVATSSQIDGTLNNVGVGNLKTDAFTFTGAAGGGIISLAGSSNSGAVSSSWQTPTLTIGAGGIASNQGIGNEHDTTITKTVP